jgi:hypothetical protein
MAQLTEAGSGFHSMVRFPFMEAAIGIVIGLVLLFYGYEQLAALTTIITCTQSFGRYAFGDMLRRELRNVHQLAAVMDLQRAIPLQQFHEMSDVFLRITEPEFGAVKDAIITQATEQLNSLADNKTSGELATTDFYKWLMRAMEQAAPGSEIWAVSFMLDCEWDDSEPERKFLELNIQAVQRKVKIERVFIVPKAEFPKLLSNKGVKAHLDNAGEYMCPKVADRDYLARHDAKLLKQLGSGMIAFDRRVAQLDIVAADGSIRGSVTMNPGEIARLRALFEGLCIHARDLKDVVAEFSSGGDRQADH